MWFKKLSISGLWQWKFSHLSHLKPERRVVSTSGTSSCQSARGGCPALSGTPPSFLTVCAIGGKHVYQSTRRFRVESLPSLRGRRRFELSRRHVEGKCTRGGGLFKCVTSWRLAMSQHRREHFVIMLLSPFHFLLPSSCPSLSQSEVAAGELGWVGCLRWPVLGADQQIRVALVLSAFFVVVTCFLTNVRESNVSVTFWLVAPKLGV